MIVTIGTQKVFAEFQNEFGNLNEVINICMRMECLYDGETILVVKMSGCLLLSSDSESYREKKIQFCNYKQRTN